MSGLLSQAELLRGLVIFLLFGSIAGLLAGMLLLWRPEWLARVSKRANRWVSTRRMGRGLGKRVNIDQWIYRYGPLSGGLLLAGAIYIIYMLTARFGRAELLASLAKMHLVQPVLLGPLLDTLVLFFLAGALLALLVSLFLLLRPSMLRDFELGANRRISLRQPLKPMEIQRGDLERLVSRHVRKAGVLLLGGSLYTLVVLAYWLGRQFNQ